MLESQRLIADDGIVLLHDAWRKHYQCAFDVYIDHTLLADELWAGANVALNLEAVLPAHAFERHAHGI